VKWQKTYGGSDNDEAYAVAIAENGDVIVAGWTYSFGAGYDDVWVLRLPQDGSLPNCDFCMDSNAQVENTDAQVESTNAEVHDTNAEIHDTNAQIQDTNAEVKTQYYKKASSGINPLYIAGALIGLLLIGGVAAKTRGRKPKPQEEVIKTKNANAQGTIKGAEGQKEPSRNEKLSELISKAKELIERRSYNEAVSVINEAMVIAPALGRAEEVESLLDSLRTRMDNLVSQGDKAIEENDLTRAQKLYTEALEIAQAIGEGEEAIRERLSKLEEKRKLELLRESVRITVPEEMLHKAENEVSIIVTNKFSDPLSLTVDLSENTDYFELSEERVEFPRIRPGKTIGESVTVKPRFLGDFDFTVKVESEKGSLSHTFPVRVSRTARLSARTPTPLTSTPILNPVEALQELYSDFQYIGEGGFARVYKAKRKDGRVIALKIPKTLDPAIGRAFVREITNWLHLKHPNIVELYDVNVLPVPYLEMEYCESSLAKLRKPLPVDEASLIVFNIAEGLKYAHSKKIVHRDLKPSNVLLKNGLPKISDWGLSKVLEESMSATTTTSFTPFYAAPEQIDKKFGHTDERTDIWQLGVIFYELVTGRLPFEGSLSQVMMGILRDDPVPPGQINPEAKEVEPIIMKMLAKRKEERYQSVEELQRDLARVLNMTYSEGLRKSKTLGDRRRAAYYLTELLLINLKTNNAGEAYKYASDLAFYVGGELKDEVRRLADQIKFRLEEGLEIPPELVEKAEIIVHRVRVGFEKP